MESIWVLCPVERKEVAPDQAQHLPVQESLLFGLARSWEAT